MAEHESGPESAPESELERAKAYTPRTHAESWQICDDCGIWTWGPFKDRRDVPEEEVRSRIHEQTGFGQFGGPKEATEPEHTSWASGPGDPVSNGFCTDCALKRSGLQGERLERLRAALTLAREEDEKKKREEAPE